MKYLFNEKNTIKEKPAQDSKKQSMSKKIVFKERYALKEKFYLKEKFSLLEAASSKSTGSVNSTENPEDILSIIDDTIKSYSKIGFVAISNILNKVKMQEDPKLASANATYKKLTDDFDTISKSNPFDETEARKWTENIYKNIFDAQNPDKGNMPITLIDALLENGFSESSTLEIKTDFNSTRDTTLLELKKVLEKIQKELETKIKDTNSKITTEEFGKYKLWLDLAFSITEQVVEKLKKERDDFVTFFEDTITKLNEFVEELGELKTSVEDKYDKKYEEDSTKGDKYKDIRKNVLEKIPESVTNTIDALCGKINSFIKALAEKFNPKDKINLIELKSYKDELKKELTKTGINLDDIKKSLDDAKNIVDSLDKTFDSTHGKDWEKLILDAFNDSTSKNKIVSMDIVWRQYFLEIWGQNYKELEALDRPLKVVLLEYGFDQAANPFITYLKLWIEKFKKITFDSRAFKNVADAFSRNIIDVDDLTNNEGKSKPICIPIWNESIMSAGKNLSYYIQYFNDVNYDRNLNQLKNTNSIIYNNLFGTDEPSANIFSIAMFFTDLRKDIPSQDDIGKINVFTAKVQPSSVLKSNMGFTGIKWIKSAKNLSSNSYKAFIESLNKLIENSSNLTSEDKNKIYGHCLNKFLNSSEGNSFINNISNKETKIKLNKIKNKPIRDLEIPTSVSLDKWSEIKNTFINAPSDIPDDDFKKCIYYLLLFYKQENGETIAQGDVDILAICNRLWPNLKMPK